MAREKPKMSQAFALVLQQRREAKKLSRQKLAEMAGLHQTAVGLIERGLRSPNLDSAHALAEALGLQLSDLITKAQKVHRKSTLSRGPRPKKPT